MSETTRVRKVADFNHLINDKSEVPADMVAWMKHWFSQFCNKEPIIESIDIIDEAPPKCRVSFSVYLKPEELQKYYDFEKLIDEGKI